jgi:hypothetical protein
MRRLCVFKTIEAICDNGKLLPIRNKLPRTRNRVLVTFLHKEAKEKPKGSRLNTIIAAGRTFKSFKGDPVKYQRILRDEW